MAPTEQDKELREKLDELLKSPRYGVSLFAGHRDILVEILADFITADRKRVALEARIEESKLIAQLFVGLPTKTMKRTDLKDYLINRITELKAQQEEL